jgi:serine/threonine protein kinase
MADPSRLNDLVAKWQSAYENGRKATAAELCPDDPRLAEQLARQIEALMSLKAPLETRPFSYKTKPPLSAVATESGELPSGAQLTSLAEFDSVRVLGQGGIGIVYAANDRRLHREVAIKLLRAEAQEDDDFQAHLAREAELTGKLEHPGVVPVYGLGECDDGRKFYVMRLIQGQSLEAAIGEHHAKISGPGGNSDGQRNLDFRGLLSRFVSVCYTVAYAHNRGVIHRDIKPENIMLGKYGETLLVDWGLAMPVDRDQQARASGERTLMLKTASQSGQSSGFPIGTPAYMSPEQAEATAPLTPATDVYSLGSTLYKLLTNAIATKGKDVFETLERAKRGAFDRPAVKNAKVPKHLDAICMKAMARDPGERYASPLELAADIEHWLADEPVSVCPETRGQQWGRWLRRHRGVALAAALSLFGLLIAAVVAAVGLKSSADRERVGREESLRLAAKFASRLIASEIDVRWRILEKEAADPRLVPLLEAEIAQPEGEARKALQNWLNESVQEHQKADLSASWFIVDRHGVLIALAGPGITPEMRGRALGKNFAHRDYFHGQGKDFDPGDVAIKPIEQPTLSTVFKSTTDKIYKVAFSVPVRKTAGTRAETIGVLATTCKVGMFEALRTLSKKDQLTALIDARNDSLDADKQVRRGLILHHRQLAKRHREGTGEQNFRVAPDFLDSLSKLRAVRLATDVESGSDGGAAEFDNLFHSYVDPLNAAETWTAAAEPVVVESRSGKMRDTGWFVLVQGK